MPARGELASLPDVFLHQHFIDIETCSRIRQGMDAGTPEPAAVLGDDGGRVATIVEVEASVLAATERVLERGRGPSEALVGRPLGEREGPSFIRYRVGDFYGRHRDSGRSVDWPPLERRRVSLVLFLNGGPDFRGGTLRLHRGDGLMDITPQPGLLVGFQSDLPHEVLPVTQGTRDVVVDWFYAAPTV